MNLPIRNYPTNELRDRSVLVLSYNGIGDTIIHAPLFAAIIRQCGSRLLHPENPGVRLLNAISSSPLRHVGCVDPRLRRIANYSSKELVSILQQFGVTAVINFRRDRERLGKPYADAVDVLSRSGIAIFDIGPQSAIAGSWDHVYVRSRRLLTGLGVSSPSHTFGWLRREIQELYIASRWPLLVYFLGASHPIKRLPPSFWCSVICGTAETLDAAVILVGGASASEVSEGIVVSNLLRQSRVKHELLAAGPLSKLAAILAQATLVISSDTFVVHLSEAVGTPVVAIHCATRPTVYGPRHHSSKSLLSPFYDYCPLKTSWANCYGWDLGCSSLNCQRFLDPRTVTSTIKQSLVNLRQSS